MIELIKEGELVNIYGSNDNENWEFIKQAPFSNELPNLAPLIFKQYKHVQYTTGDKPVKNWGDYHNNK